MYSSAVHDEQTIRARIMVACETVRTTPGSFDRVCHSLCKDDQRLVFRQVEGTLNISCEREQITPTPGTSFHGLFFPSICMRNPFLKFCR